MSTERPPNTNPFQNKYMLIFHLAFYARIQSIAKRGPLSKKRAYHIECRKINTHIIWWVLNITTTTKNQQRINFLGTFRVERRFQNRVYRSQQKKNEQKCPSCLALYVLRHAPCQMFDKRDPPCICSIRIKAVMYVFGVDIMRKHLTNTKPIEGHLFKFSWAWRELWCNLIIFLWYKCSRWWRSFVDDQIWH